MESIKRKELFVGQEMLGDREEEVRFFTPSMPIKTAAYFSFIGT